MTLQIPGYRITRKINQGGMATVYLALQLSVGREVALKVMAPALSANPGFSERFQQEATIVGQLSHPHIVSIYDIGRHQDLNYIAMDYLPGGSVHDKMSSGINQAEALAIIEQIALALDYAHEKGYVHRDIKPENILFREDGSAVLSDFGVARTLNSNSQMTSVDSVIGTPYYMSPEQAQGKPVDGRGDLYSLGVLLFEMLTGSVPYRAEEAVAVALKHLTAPIPKLPAQHARLQPLLNQLLAKAADDRFQRGRQVAEAIHLLAGVSTGVPLGASLTLAGRAAYLTQTGAGTTSIQILSLLRVLLVTSGSALLMRARALPGWLCRWRYSLQLGLHQRPPLSITQIRPHSSTAEANRATLISTAGTGNGNTVLARGRAHLTLLLPSLAALASVWLAVSIAVSGYGPATQQPPSALLSAAINSGSWARQLLPSTPASAGNGEVKRDEDAGTNVLDSAGGETPDLQDPGTQQLAASAGSSPPELEAAPEPIVPAPMEATLSPPVPPRFGLTVDTTPPGARVRVLNIKEKYYAGIPLIPGDYHIEVSRRGYHHHFQWVELGHEDLALPVTLREKPLPGSQFYDDLRSGGKGPAMVIVADGEFPMGNRGESNASPVRQVKIARAFAVSQYEITFADYQKFAQQTQRPLPADNRWGRGSRPVVNINWHDARAYSEWLSEATGRRYRLPSEAEWEYFARANSRGDYFWSNKKAGASEQQARANCRRGCNSPFSNLLRTKTAPVGSFASNAFNIYDTAGNVAEWVEDCYQNHYLAAPVDGSAVKRSDCPLRSVRGGSIKSPLEDIKSHSRDRRNPDRTYTDVGFRVVAELE